ncbi:MAG TPA: ABC transporter substrate-binding protein [bacterium]|nr:ABC transporter substrate-binding protein [bacterium]HPJ71939.1 ABC transporter substrate-binding protein [bacterium]HPQ65585.1 ABC transporter substrate-binding protein [bacterium]
MNIRPAIGTLLAVLLLCCGCSGASREGGPEEGKVEIRFWHAMGGPLGEVLGEMIDEFNRAHPESFIRAESMGSYEALKQKLLASIIAGNQPDMAQAYEAWISTLLGGEALVDLGELDPEFREEDLDDFYPVFIDDSLYLDKLYSLPFNKSVPVIYYNRDMFRRAGLDPDLPPRTWDEFVEVSRKLTRDLDGDGKPDQWGHKFTDHATYFECLLVQNGGSIIDPESGRMAFNSERGVEALSFLVDLVRTYEAADFYLGGYQHQVDFAAQNVGMIVASCVSRSFMTKQLNFDWGMAPLLEKERPGSLVYGTNIVIFSRSSRRKQEAAWRFIKWFTSPEQTARWSIRTNYVPVRRSALDLPVMKSAIAEKPSTAVPIRALEYGFFEPRMAQWLRVREYLGDAVKEALLLKLTPKQALDRAVAKGELWL